MKRVLACCAVLVAGGATSANPVTNASFESSIGGAAIPGSTTFTNGWRVQGVVGSGNASSHTSTYGLGTLTPTNGGSMALLLGNGLNALGNPTIGSFVQSDVFTVGSAGATLQFDYFFDFDPSTAPLAQFLIGTATPLGNNPAGTAPVDLIPLQSSVTPKGWTTGPALALAAGDWGLTFTLVSQAGLPQSYFGVDNIVVTENPVIPLPSGAALAMGGIGLLGIRRRRG